MDLHYWVYLLFSEKDLFLYTGFKSNLQVRIKNHNCGKVKSTADRRPLVYIFAEHFLFECDARKRERYFKTTLGKKAVRLMLRSTLVQLGYRAETMKLVVIEGDICYEHLWENDQEQR